MSREEQQQVEVARVAQSGRIDELGHGVRPVDILYVSVLLRGMQSNQSKNLTLHDNAAVGTAQGVTPPLDLGPIGVQ
jgi:hypothetical protein